MENSGYNAGMMMVEVLKAEKNFGIDVMDGTLKDLVKIGVIDPVKVTRTALQNASSIAVMVATTQVLITDLPEKEKPAMPGGGGMPGMGEY